MEKAGKSQGEGIQGQGQMVLQKKSEAFWQSWWVGGDETGSGRGQPRCSKSELEVLILFGRKLNPGSWQPGVSQTPAQLLALRFPSCRNTNPLLQRQMHRNLFQEQALSGQGSHLSKERVTAPEGPASLHSERQSCFREGLIHQ